MVINEKQLTPDEIKKGYFEMIRLFNSVPMDKYSLINNVIASFYARKYLNSHPEKYSEITDMDTINSEFKYAINFINGDFILDINLILKKITDHVNYYRHITFHEWVSNGIVYPMDDFMGLDQHCIEVYYNLGYNMIYSPSEYKIIVENSSLFRDLSEKFAIGAKYRKHYISTNGGSNE